MKVESLKLESDIFVGMIIPAFMLFGNDSGLIHERKILIDTDDFYKQDDPYYRIAKRISTMRYYETKIEQALDEYDKWKEDNNV